MAQAVRVHVQGGPEVLSVAEVDPGLPGPGHVRLRQTAIGVNYLDIYQRSGLYKLASLPAVLGNEGAGVVTEVGAGVTSLKPGDRVAYGTLLGGYASERLAPADRLIKLPDAISDETAAAMMLQGMTVRYLLRQTYACTPDTVALFHAAAGGVGLIACQWARAIGMTLIGTAGSDEKCELAREHGATHVINYRTENFVGRVAEITGGRGCDVVYDSIGKDTFPGSLDCLKPRGLWVSFGNASGPVPPFEMTMLSAKGSLFATRPTLFSYTNDPEELRGNAAELIEMVASGRIAVTVAHRYALARAADAHRDLEARRTTGSIVLIPD